MGTPEEASLISMAFESSPWQKEGNTEWFLNDGALREIVEAEKTGLYHPPKSFYYLKSRFFDRLMKEKDLHGIIIIRGPRRIGKTSTLKHIIRKMIEEGHNPNSFVYVSLDDEKLFPILEKKKHLRTFLKAIITHYGKDRPIIIVLDEVTFYKGWARALKNLVDQGDIGKGVGIIATGSYSLDLSTAKAELLGRYGPLGEPLKGELSFFPRRFVEVSDSLLNQNFNGFMKNSFGKVGMRMGFIEFLGGYQDERTSANYGYETKIDQLLNTYYSDLHGVLNNYFFSGGYPRAFFQMTREQKISDARYNDDIYGLLLADCKKFNLDENILTKMLTKIEKPVMCVDKNCAALFPSSSSLKLDLKNKYLAYLEASELIGFFPTISSPDQINAETKLVNPSNEKKKMIVRDPAAFISFYAGTRGMSNIYKKMETILPGQMKDFLFESIVLSHLRYLPINMPFKNIAGLLESQGPKEEELADAFIWYLNYQSDFISIPIEVKHTEKINRGQIQKKAEILKERYNSKRLIVVARTKELELTPDYAIIPAEAFLLMF